MRDSTTYIGLLLLVAIWAFLQLACSAGKRESPRFPVTLVRISQGYVTKITKYGFSAELEMNADTTGLAEFIASSRASGIDMNVGLIAGRITDESSGHPLIGVRVLVPCNQFAARTDSNGYYLLRFVEPGIHTVSILHLDYPGREVQEVPVRADSVTTLSVSLPKSVPYIQRQR